MDAALSAKIDEIKDINLKLAKALQAKKSESKKPAAKKPSKPSKKSGKKSDKNKNKWAWKEVKPASGEPLKKKFEGKEYFWCRFHKRWTLHNPDGTGESRCTLNPVANAATVQEDNQEQSSDNANKTLAAIIKSFEDEE